MEPYDDQQKTSSRKHGRGSDDYEIQRLLEEKRKILENRNRFLERIQKYPTADSFERCRWNEKKMHLKDGSEMNVDICTVIINVEPLVGFNFKLEKKEIYAIQPTENEYQILKIIYYMKINGINYHYTIHENKKPHIRSSSGSSKKIFGYLKKGNENHWKILGFISDDLCRSVCKVWNYMVEYCGDEIDVEQQYHNLNCDNIQLSPNVSEPSATKKYEYEYKYKKYKGKYLRLINKLSKSLVL